MKFPKIWEDNSLLHVGYRREQYTIKVGPNIQVHKIFSNFPVDDTIRNLDNMRRDPIENLFLVFKGEFEC